jgi:hypothetical protein
MSLEALEKEIAGLDDAMLRRLQAFIFGLRQRRDPGWRAEMARRIDDRTPGRWMSLKEAERELDARRG